MFYDFFLTSLILRNILIIKKQERNFYNSFILWLSKIKEKRSDSLNLQAIFELKICYAKQYSLIYYTATIK